MKKLVSTKFGLIGGLLLACASGWGQTPQLYGGEWRPVPGGTNLPGAETITWTNLFYGRTNQLELFRIRARVE